MKRLVVACSVVVVVALTALGSGAGVAASRAAGLPAGLAAAIHARLGAGAIRASSASGSVGSPNLGLSIAVSQDGTTALVGAPGVARGRGAAYIFHASAADSWTSTTAPTATLLNKRGVAGDYFGDAVALSADGTTAFVGAPFAGSTSLLSAGAIYVFQASSESGWSSSSSPKAMLTVKNGGQGVGLGFALAPSQDGTTLVSGAPYYHFPIGGAFVFHVPSEGAWATRSTATAALSSSAIYDSLVGISVAISADGTTALVGDLGHANGGGAYLYHVSAEDSWASSSTPTATLSDSGGATGDGLGGSLALSPDGTLALLGTHIGNPQIGYVDVFHSSGEASWASTSTPLATLSPPGGGVKGDDFGTRVAVSSDGTTALVGAPGVNQGRGAAYVFRAASESAWASSSAPAANLTNSGGQPKDELGFGLALAPDGATALLGAPLVDQATGAVDVSHVADAGSWADNATPTAILTDKDLAACVVPKLKGLKLAAAKDALAAGRCRVGKVTKVHASAKARGRVLVQSPKPGKRLAIGAKVAVRVGK